MGHFYPIPSKMGDVDPQHTRPATSSPVRHRAGLTAGFRNLNPVSHLVTPERALMGGDAAGLGEGL
jgi:hypothetical protein